MRARESLAYAVLPQLFQTHCHNTRLDYNDIRMGNCCIHVVHWPTHFFSCSSIPFAHTHSLFHSSYFLSLSRSDFVCLDAIVVAIVCLRHKPFSSNSPTLIVSSRSHLKHLDNDYVVYEMYYTIFSWILFTLVYHALS